MIRWSPAIAFCSALCLVSSLAHADASSDQGGELYSVEKRDVLGTHELSVSVGTLPMDAFGKGLTLRGTYTYHFSHLIAWEVIGGTYSFIISTSLRDDLRDRFEAQPEEEGDLKGIVDSNFEFKPLYGKLAWLNDTLLTAEMFFVVGPAIGFFDDASRPIGLNGGVGLRFFLGRYFSARLDIRDYLFLPGFNDFRNHLSISLGIGLTFGFRELDRVED